MFEDYKIEKDSFGQDCPTNWEEIAEYLNDQIDAIIDEHHGCASECVDAIDQVWESYWSQYSSGELPDDAPVPETTDGYRGKVAKIIEGCKDCPYTESEFAALPFGVRDGVERFWEPGYDYTSVDFWADYPALDVSFVEAVIRYDAMKKEEDKPTRSISIDNGNTYVTPAKAIAEMDWDVIVSMMDDEIREAVHADMAPCTEEEFLTEYLHRADEDLIIG